jgi:uncharacterized cupin superfamily protein
MAPVLTGNASVDGVPSQGWFIGHFLTNAQTLRSTRAVEVKWSAYQAGEERPQWGTSEKITLCVLIKGRIRLVFPSEECLLAQEGDYVIWRAGLPHSWRIEEDALVLTMRWLAPTDLYKEALSHLFCTLKARAAP